MANKPPPPSPPTKLPKTAKSQLVQPQKQNLHREEEKSEKNCCIFSTMVPCVLLIFILYVSSYLGAMSIVSAEKNDLRAENFTISDALKQAPPQFHLANNLQAMAEMLSQPNQFMAKGK